MLSRAKISIQAIGLSLLAATVAGCGILNAKTPTTTLSPTGQFVSSMGYQFTVPTGWRSGPNVKPGNAEFLDRTDSLRGAEFYVGATRYPYSNSIDEVGPRMLRDRERIGRGFALVSQSTTTLAGEKAFMFTYTSVGPRTGLPLENTPYIVLHGGKLYLVMCGGPQSIFDQAQPTLQQTLSTFKFMN